MGGKSMKFKRVLAMAVTAVMTCSLLAGGAAVIRREPEAPNLLTAPEAEQNRMQRRRIPEAEKNQI